MKTCILESSVIYLPMFLQKERTAGDDKRQDTWKESLTNCGAECTLGRILCADEEETVKKPAAGSASQLLPAAGGFSQRLPPRFSSVLITTTQSSRTVCITRFMRFSGIATQPPV